MILIFCFLRFIGLAVAQESSDNQQSYQQQCRAGDFVACNNLGALYEEGIQVEQDYKTAISLYTKACNGGLAWSCKNVGVLYEEGRGVDKNLTKARSFYEFACQYEMTHRIISSAPAPVEFSYDRSFLQS